MKWRVLRNPSHASAAVRRAHTTSATMESRRVRDHERSASAAISRPLPVIELDEPVERVVGLLRRRLELAPGPGLGLLQRPDLDAGLHVLGHAPGRVEPAPRVLLELDFTPESRQVQVALPRVFGQAHVKGQGPHPLAIAARALPQIELDLRQASSHCAQLHDARHRVVGDLVRLLGDRGQAGVRVERQAHEARDRQDEAEQQQAELAPSRTARRHAAKRRSDGDRLDHREDPLTLQHRARHRSHGGSVTGGNVTV